MGMVLQRVESADGVGDDRRPLAARPVRIVRLITRLNIGGPAVHVATLATRLTAMGFETQIIAGELAEGERHASHEVFKDLPQQPISLAGFSRDVSILRDVRTLWRLVRILRAKRPDIVHTHTSKAGALGRLAAAIAGVPIRVHTFHGLVFSGHFSRWRSRLYIHLERLLGRLSSCVVVISRRQQDELIFRYRIVSSEKVECIPLGFEVGPYLQARAASFAIRHELNLTGRHFLVGWVGRLVPVKDPFLLIETAKHVLKSLPSCHFVLVGDGEMREMVERAIHLAGLAGHIHLLGWRNDLSDVYSDFDLTFLTSLSEGTPLALLETMACGKPFVAPRIGGVPDLVFGQDREVGGVSYFQNAALANREPRALANGILRLLFDQPLRERMGEAARQFVISKFSADRLANDLAALYSKLLMATRREKYVEVHSLAVQERAVPERPWSR